MSIHGVLEDLALADVLQFVHLSRRTGTLFMWREDERRAEIGFYDGHIVSAWSPGHRRLGDMLVAAEVVDQETLEKALSRQKEEHGERILGQILLSDGAVTKSDIHRADKSIPASASSIAFSASLLKPDSDTDPPRPRPDSTTPSSINADRTSA